MLEAADFDPERGGARLLGEDVAEIATGQTRGRLQAVLQDMPTFERLTTDMARSLRMREDSQTYAERLLKEFAEGMVRHP